MSETMNSVNVLEPPARPLPDVRKRPAAAFFTRLASAVPNLLVLLALGGLAWWGHSTGWKLPKFSELTGNGGGEKGDWCKEHSVPESACVECQPDLLPRRKAPGWCRVHGVHECPWEHPEVAQLKTVPRVTPEALERARRALAFAERPANTSKCKLHLRRIQFASEEAVAKAGIDVTTVQQGPVTEAVLANGEVVYDQTRVARLSSLVPGKVRRVEKKVGQAVKEGEVVLLVDALEVGKTKAEFGQALAQVGVLRQRVASMTPAYKRGSIPEATFLAQEAALQEAEIRLAGAEQALANLGLPAKADDYKGLSAGEVRRRLQFLGLPPALAKDLEGKVASANLLPVTSPIGGEVVALDAVAGEVVDASKVLFVVADTSRMWLDLKVRVEDANSLKLGQPVRFRPDGATKDAEGEVDWVSTAVDEKTRTVKVRVGLSNPDGRLRASTFGSGRIILREEPEAVVVPSEAVQWEGDCHVVFVRDKNYLDKGAPKVFHTRTVRPGARDGAVTEMIAGVLPGEVVVTKGSGLLRSELLKNNLGAG